MCGHSAYRGTVGLDSVCFASAPFREMLRSGGNAQHLTEAAYRAGTRSLAEDGYAKILNGLTSFEEVLSAAPRPSTAFESVITKENLTQRTSSAADQRVSGALQAIDEDFFRQSESAPAKTQILVVEDDADQREILELVFRAGGYEVLGAEDGMSAIALLETQNVSAIVCDLMMPKMSGEELVQRVRSNPLFRDLPILMLTALDSADKEAEVLAKGADDYCAKNVKRKVLLSRLERLLQRNAKHPSKKGPATP